MTARTPGLKVARVIVSLSDGERQLPSGALLTIGADPTSDPDVDIDEATGAAWLAHGFIEPADPGDDPAVQQRAEKRTAERAAPRRAIRRTGKQ